VDLNDLTPRQAGELANRLQPMLGYLTRLTDRMQKRGWRAGDPVYRSARAGRISTWQTTTAIPGGI
jgi:hypothetical protein